MPYRRVVTDRTMVAKHAAPEAISAYIREVVEAQKQADEEYHWLANLYESKVKRPPSESTR